MKFSLWMILEALKEFGPMIYIKEEETRTIEKVRLYSEGTTENDDTLYITMKLPFVSQRPGQIICAHNNNFILLNTDDINGVFNCVLAFFDQMQTWYFELSSLLSGHCLLNQILNHFSDILKRPLMVLDASQIVLASSDNFGYGSIDSRWDQMLESGSFGVEIIEEYNRLHQNQTKRLDAYLIPANPFPFPSYNKNIFVDNEFTGFVSMIVKDTGLEQSEKDWFELVCEAVVSWFSLYADHNEMAIRHTLFRELLDGQLDHGKKFLDTLNAHGWKKNGKKRLYLLSCISSHLNMNQHITRILNQKTDLMYAITGESHIIVLVNEDRISYTDTCHFLQPLLQNSGYFAGNSNAFSAVTELPDQFELSKIALQSGSQIPGAINACHEYVIPYVFSVLRSNMKLDLCHPAVYRLHEYDSEHATDYAALLYQYLQNSCSQTKTAHALCMHRNSLIRKITFIRDLCGIDLEDYETRLHLILSFEYERYGSSHI